MQNVVEKLRKYYLYGIRLGYRTIITEKKTENISEEEFQYPIHLENRIQTALCGTKADWYEKKQTFYWLYKRNEMQSTIYTKNL